jgi:hypothetical protein
VLVWIGLRHVLGELKVRKKRVLVVQVGRRCFPSPFSFGIGAERSNQPLPPRSAGFGVPYSFRMSVDSLRELRNVDDLFSLRKPVFDRLDRVACVRKIASRGRWLAPARKRRGARFCISNPPLSSRRRVARRLGYSGSG